MEYEPKTNKYFLIKKRERPKSAITLCYVSKINANNDEKETIVLKSEPIGDTQETALAVSKIQAPKNEPIGDALSIRGRLHLLGWKSFNVWGVAHGYKPGSVRAAIRTWGLRTDRAPHGGISRAVMRDLRTTLAMSVRPACSSAVAVDAPSQDMFSAPQEARD